MKNDLQISAICPRVCLADTDGNAKNIIKLVKQAVKKGAQIIITPELAVTGATCGDLFFKPLLIDNSLKALNKILKEIKKLDAALIIGLPLRINQQIINASALLYRGKILGIVPKKHLNSDELRYFVQANQIKENKIVLFNQKVPLGTNLLFNIFNTTLKIKIGLDLDKNPPLSIPKGIDVICNLASNCEYLGKQAKLKNLAAEYSARHDCTYVYASSGFGESSAEEVYSANALIYNKGTLLKETPRLTMQEQIIICGINQNILKTKPAKFSNICDVKHPFNPINKQELFEVLDLQSLALARRLEQTKINKVILGISGGLDSTLTLIAAVHTFKKLNLPLKNIFAYTLPGLGTTARTKNNALLLCKELGVSFEEIDIKQAVLQHFKDIKHNKNIVDITYENTQARERTQILFDLSNKLGALVLGTGDMSELALGWATYGGDHLSMYGLNAGIPKTLIKEIVTEYAKNAPSKISEILKDILETPISPELKPVGKGKIIQKTEDLVGPYILHDFFLYHFLVNNSGPREIYKLALSVFKADFTKAEIKHWLEIFFRRFFSQQFKRSCSPEGPKVLQLSLSPRAGLRLTSDISPSIWLGEIKALK